MPFSSTDRTGCTFRWGRALVLFALVLPLAACQAPDQPARGFGAQFGGAPLTRFPDFPWPPPQPSAEHLIENAWLTNNRPASLADVSASLERAIKTADFETWSYSAVPHGFALATQVEQINEDGTPIEGFRFMLKPPSLSQLSFVEFLKALGKSPAGFYRVIVFVVTDEPYARTAAQPTENEAKEWLRGLDRLPRALGSKPYGPGFRTTALVYQFELRPGTSTASLVSPSVRSAREHLMRARLWDALASLRR